MTASSTPAADALAAARQNMKDLEAAAKAEKVEARRREREERESALGKEVAAFQEQNYEHVIGGIGDYIGISGLDIDFVEYTTVQSSRSLTKDEGFALYSALEDILGI